MLFPQLREFIESVIAKLSITKKYRFGFRVNDQWKSKPLTHELFNQLMDNLTKEKFIYDMDNKPVEYFYDNCGQELPEWSLFDAISVKPVSGIERREG